MSILTTSLSVLFKIAGFFVFMFVAGRKFLPWLLVNIAKMRSTELSTLGTLAIAVGFASIAYFVFDASLALGAFLAGVMLGESEIGRKSSESTIPMRDTFAVLFFVSVGMLFNPATILTKPFEVFITFITIVLAKAIVAALILYFLKQQKDTRYIVSIGLAQIGEFSFILGGLALNKGLLDSNLYSLILAGAMLSILINPILFHLCKSHCKAVIK